MPTTLKRTLGCAFPLLMAVLLSAGEVPAEGLIAHFKFEGNGLDENRANPAWELANTKFEDGALFLNGWYDGVKDPPGYRAVLNTPALRPEKFSIALRLKPTKAHEGAQQSSILSASNWHRWFGLQTDDTCGGKLLVKFNNGAYSFRIEGSRLRPEIWTVLVCTVDVAARQISVYQDGRRVGNIALPADFILDALNLPDAEFQKNNVLTFTNYSNGQVFTGWIDEMLLYRRILTEDEVAKLPLRP